MKKGQVMGLPLVLIFALIVGALILFWGIKTVLDLNTQADYAQLADKVTDMQNEVETFSKYDEGATKKYTIDMPGLIEYVCFYNGNENYNCVLDNGLPCPEEMNEYIEAVVVSSRNVYLYPPEYETNYFTVEQLIPAEANPQCISNRQQGLLRNEVDSVTIAYYEA